MWSNVRVVSVLKIWHRNRLSCHIFRIVGLWAPIVYVCNVCGFSSGSLMVVSFLKKTLIKYLPCTYHCQSQYISVLKDTCLKIPSDSQVMNNSCWKKHVTIFLIFFIEYCTIWSSRNKINFILSGNNRRFEYFLVYFWLKKNVLNLITYLLHLYILFTFFWCWDVTRLSLSSNYLQLF